MKESTAPVAPKKGEKVKVCGLVYVWNGEWWVNDDFGHQKGLSPNDPRLETAEKVQ